MLHLNQMLDRHRGHGSQGRHSTHSPISQRRIASLACRPPVELAGTVAGCKTSACDIAESVLRPAAAPGSHPRTGQRLVPSRIWRSPTVPWWTSPPKEETPCSTREAARRRRPCARTNRRSAPCCCPAGRDFWRLWSVGLVVFTVRWLETIAVAVFVYERTHSPFLVAMMTMLRLLPMGLFGAFMGAAAERLDRRIVLIGVC